MFGVNHQAMSGTNKFLVLKTIITQGPVSRVSLSQKTGLSKMTITQLVRQYIEMGIVRERGVEVSGGGRRPALLDVIPDSLLTLGIFIDRGSIRAGILDLKGNVLRNASHAFSSIQGNDAFIECLYQLCDPLLNGPERERIWGIGISSAGPVYGGVILNPPNFNSIQNVPVESLLHKRYQLPVYLQLDTCVAALAEVYYGQTQQIDSFLYIGLGPGIGGGLIIDKKLYTGSNGLAGIVGHCIVKRNGLQCECGQRGCLEKYSSTAAVVAWAKEQGAEESLDWRGLVARASAGDSLCRSALDRMGDYLTMALTNMVIAYDPEAIIMGGDLYECRDWMVAKIRNQLHSSALAWGDRMRKVAVLPSSFIGEPCFIGSVPLVLENNLAPREKAE